MKTSLAVKSRKKPVVLKHEKRERTVRDAEGNLLSHTWSEDVYDFDGNIMFSAGEIKPLLLIVKSARA